MREHFIHEMEKLKYLLMRMSAESENAVVRAIGAMNTTDCVEAQEVISNDVKIDALENEIEEECLKLMALYQPVARDLRVLTTVLKVNNELERIADLACKIAERALDMCRYNRGDYQPFAFEAMVTSALAMVHDVLHALMTEDVDEAEKVIQQDDALDALHRANYRLAEQLIVEHPEAAGYYLDSLTVSRALERIGDIATNIAEDVIYLLTAKIVRHVHTQAASEE